MADIVKSVPYVSVLEYHVSLKDSEENDELEQSPDIVRTVFEGVFKGFGLGLLD